MSRRFFQIILEFQVMQALIIRAKKVDCCIELHIDFAVAFLYSVLQVRHIFGLQKHMLPSVNAAAVLFLRLILPLDPLKIPDLQVCTSMPGDRTILWDQESHVIGSIQVSCQLCSTILNMEFSR